MKKLLSIALALALILSLSVPAFAAGNAPDVLYIDVAGVADSEKTISGVWLWVYANSGTEISNQQMTHVSGTVYSYDISSVSDPGGKASYEIYYTDDTSTTSNTTTFESGKNLFTATGEGKGTWSVYGESTTPETPAGPTVTNGDKNVTGKYVAGAESRVIYKVDITWGSMAFTYTDASKGNWNTDEHKYNNGTAAGWSWVDGANVISVTNHSNDGITVTPGYTPDAAYASATMTLSTSTLSLGTADNGENGAAGTATSGTITVTPGGSVPAGTTGKIGQITLSIAGASGSSAGEEPAEDKAVIIGFYTTVDGTKHTSGTVTVSSSTDWSITFTGTNLDSVTDDNQYGLDYNGQLVSSTFNANVWNANEDGTEITCSQDLEELTAFITAFKFKFSNDGGETWTDSDVEILYDTSGDDDPDESGDVTTVTTLDQLTDALASGGSIKLGADITMTEYALITSTAKLDLNQHTLTTAGNGLYVATGGNLTLTNGTAVNNGSTPVSNNGGVVTIENCTLTGDVSAVYHTAGTSTLKNCTLNGQLTLDQGSVSDCGTATLQGNFTWNAGTSSATYQGIWVTKDFNGSLSCDFDPTSALYNMAPYNNWKVTDNNDGTWTVANET